MSRFAGVDELQDVPVGEVTLRVRVRGVGPPLLLLHGYPQSHVMWDQVGDALADAFTVVAPDLRGYGGSTAPADAPGAYGKRAMARDAVALMAALGHERFDVAGHDRGGRVAYRLALDAPQAVRRLTVLDIVPTAEVWARADDRFALAYWHWPFLAQPHPVPERLIAGDPEFFFLDAQFGGVLRTFPAAAEYARAVHDSKVVHAICEDYRAGADYDRELDEQDRAAGRRISCPVQVLWGERGALPGWYDVLALWRDWADDVVGHGLDCGHFVPEEQPVETAAALRAFHG